MVKNLVIVESPAKAKTIEGYLGQDFVVRSSYGHVRDLPKDNNAIDIANGFKPTYVVSADKRELIAQLKKLSKEAETVWLASDDDREGEAICWHLAETLNLPEAKTRRIVFREITKNAILAAIANPRTVNQDLVNAQQARRVLDRLVGFELSPVLWKKVKPGLSAGRVQSVAVRLVVEREREVASHLCGQRLPHCGPLRCRPRCRAGSRAAHPLQNPGRSRSFSGSAAWGPRTRLKAWTKSPASAARPRPLPPLPCSRKLRASWASRWPRP